MSRVRKEGRNATMADSLKSATKMASQNSDSALAAHSEALSFRKNIFQTGLFEVDVNLRPVFGSRIQLLGDAHHGKSLLANIMMASAHKTCRQCMTPIIDFVNDWSGEVATTCKCGACDPMRVMLVDSENSFDPAWASTWGVDIDPDFSPDSEGVVEVAEDTFVSADARFVVVRGADAEQTRIVTENMIRDGAVDFVVVDSLATLVPKSRREGKQMIGDHAKTISQFTTGVVAAQGEAANLDGVAPTILMINQKRVNIGGFSPVGTPTQAAGGMALKYNNSITWDLRTVYNNRDFKMGYKFGDSILTAKKDKESGATNSKAAYRCYVDDYEIKGVPYHAGDTDEGNKVYGFLKELGGIDNRWFQKKGSKYIILGREFTKVADIAAFLGRRDVGHLLRFPIFAQKFPKTLRQHLGADNFNYTPFKDDPILEMYEEAEKLTGSNVQSRERQLNPVMLGKKTPGGGKSKDADSADIDKLLDE